LKWISHSLNERSLRLRCLVSYWLYARSDPVILRLIKFHRFFVPYAWEADGFFWANWYRPFYEYINNS